MASEEIVVKQMDEARGIGCRGIVSVTGIPDLLGDVFGAVIPSGLPVTGPPFIVYHDFEFDPEHIDVEVVVPVRDPGERTLTTPAGRTLDTRSVCGGEMAVLVHVGPYDTLHESYRALTGWVSEHGYAAAGPPQEIYLTGPDEPGPPVTELRLPVAETAD